VKIFIGSDHNGFSLRPQVVSHLQKQGLEVVDDSTGALNPEDDYPVFAAKVAQDLLTSNDAEPRGILICGSGQGMFRI
jgi:ribose 5-phosphate isomerase B